MKHGPKENEEIDVYSDIYFFFANVNANVSFLRIHISFILLFARPCMMRDLKSQTTVRAPLEIRVRRPMLNNGLVDQEFIGLPHPSTIN